VVPIPSFTKVDTDPSSTFGMLFDLIP
jgi:hypothetical protein